MSALKKAARKPGRPKNTDDWYGLTLRSIRIANGFPSSESFADAVTDAGYEISGRGVRYWETGKSTPSKDAVKVMSKLLSINQKRLRKPIK